MAWEDVDEKCIQCGQVTKVARGINKQNLKRLLIGTPTITDWMLFFILCMVFLLAWRYNVETADCRYIVNNISGICFDYCSNTGLNTQGMNPIPNRAFDLDINTLMTNLSLNGTKE